MKELTRTGVFVGVALVSAAVAWFVHAGSRPDEPAAFAKIGTEFYPDFDDPTEAGSLEIVHYDENLRETQTFKVEFDRGQWRIPSHHGYPADAKDHLEKAAASLIGITRQALAGRRENSHERFGVLQPPSKTPLEDEILEGIGQRIVLKDKKGKLLADYLLGKRVAGEENLYFVRTPEEKETYRATVELDVSTKFSDWIEKDLLKLDRADLLSIELKTPKFEVAETPFGVAKRLVGESFVKVHRDETGPGAKWQTAELNPQTEEINTSGVSQIQTALDSLQLNGVRPKPQGLTPRLTVDLEQFPKDQHPQQHFEKLQRDLTARGFMLAMPPREEEEEKYLLFGEGGEMVAESNEGLVYHLHFGKAFAGTQQEIEVGKTKVADEQGNEVSAPEADKDSGEDSPSDKTTLNRYLFIRVEFDEKLLGKKPVEPKEPQKPEGVKEAPATPEGAKEKTPEELEQERLRSEYNSQMALYRSEKAIYEEDIKEYEEKHKAGEAKAAELNARFGDWYYVVPATSYENLVFTRADIVKAKEKEEPKAEPESQSAPSSPLDDFIRGKSNEAESATEPKPAVAEKPAKSDTPE